MPYACRAITQDMRHIHSLKHRFDIALNDALNGRDITPALELKDELKAAIEALYRETWPFDSPELTMGRVTEAVRHYRNLYESTGVINNRGESVLRLPGESTDRHYPMPTEAQVVDYLRSQTNHETVKHLLELGLVKLAIVPLSGFGNADTINAINAGRYGDPTVPPLVRAVGEKLRQKYDADELVLADGTLVTEKGGFQGNHGRNFLYVQNDYANLAYRHGVKKDLDDTPKIDPATNQPARDWKPSDYMLDPVNHATPFLGWQLMLTPSDSRVVRRYPVDSELAEFNANRNIVYYIANLKTIPGLTGWTPEAELVVWLERLNSPGFVSVLRDESDPADGSTLLPGVTIDGPSPLVARWSDYECRLFLTKQGALYSASLGALPAGAV